jgi:hypothetical protein
MIPKSRRKNADVKNNRTVAVELTNLGMQANA